MLFLSHIHTHAVSTAIAVEDATLHPKVDGAWFYARHTASVSLVALSGIVPDLNQICL